MAPTIGRKVWYWGKNEPEHTRDCNQAFDAEIIFVESDDRISIVYRTHYGSQFVLHNVVLQNPDEDYHDPRFGGHCTWMPYQVGLKK